MFYEGGFIIMVVVFKKHSWIRRSKHWIRHWRIWIRHNLGIMEYE
jgi:hypothetical protein